MGYNVGPPPGPRPTRRPPPGLKRGRKLNWADTSVPWKGLVGEVSAEKIAAHAHAEAGQDYGGRPYLHHIRQVVAVLTEFGYHDDETLQAGYLHDTIEDTELTMDKLLELGFAPATIRAVLFCTDEEGRNRKIRKARTYERMTREVRAHPEDPEVIRGVRVKLADRIANVRYCIATKDKGLFKMYQKDAPFAAALQHTGICDEMWAEYERLMVEGLGSSVMILE
jgi:guanosine-3',5'-bis(diphosphate) 3'-pyrophosphohydrolase